jgi:hypothetical protein
VNDGASWFVSDVKIDAIIRTITRLYFQHTSNIHMPLGNSNIVSRSICGLGVDIGFINHLHDSKLREIAASSLISTIHKSPQHSTFFQPMSLPAVPWQRLLRVEILQLPRSRAV